MSADGQRLFMISEFEPMVFSAHIVPKSGVLELVSTVALAGSDVRPQPSGLLYDEATSRLYAGLRSTDEIARLKVDPANGHLDLELSWPCGGMTPRDLAFAPGGAFLVVANQDADRLTTFRVGPERQFKPQHIAVKKPMVVAFATLKD
jgi:6-phosphogluconolactonase